MTQTTEDFWNDMLDFVEGMPEDHSFFDENYIIMRKFEPQDLENENYKLLARTILNCISVVPDALEFFESPMSEKTGLAIHKVIALVAENYRHLNPPTPLQTEVPVTALGGLSVDQYTQQLMNEYAGLHQVVLDGPYEPVN